MASTQVPTGSALAVKLYSVALFTRMARRQTFRKKLTGAAPKQGEAEAKLRHETSAGMPIVEIRDLSKTAGDRVTVDLIDIVNGEPVMGDVNLSGKMMALQFANDEIRIDQYRGGLDPGGRMAQQRTEHNLRGLALANLEGWLNTVLDNISHIHLAGARGFQTGKDWNVPLASSSSFASIVVNTVTPPSYNRRFIPSGGHVTSDIDATDKLTINVLDDLREAIDESEYPLQGIKLENDPAADDEDPLYVMYISPKQWTTMQKDTSTQNWRTFVAAAHERGSLTKHPLFLGQTGMWRGILVKVTRRSIRFTAGSSVPEYATSSTTTITNGTAAVQFDRAILLGAQALGCAYGRDYKSGYYMRWHEEETDHGNRKEESVSLMGGWKKLTFTAPGDVVPTDHGVWAVDTYTS